MRRTQNQLDADAAQALLAQAAEHRLATTTPDGRPVLRTLNGVVLGDAVYFHGSPKGEKTRCVGRPAVVAVDEVVARIPSHWIDPERACPASTWYRSAQVHGPLLVVENLTEKAAALAGLMAQRQPEGGHRPITAEDPLYAKVIRGLLVLKVPFDEVCGKALLGQGQRSRLPAILRGLWGRGDTAAIETVRAAHGDGALPEVFNGPVGYRLHVHLPDPQAAVALLMEQYWTAGVSAQALRSRLEGASAWAGARTDEGALVATASALGDGARGWLMDVAVHPVHRGRGLGRAVCRLLLDHARLRHAQVGLGTRDAQELYMTLGFTTQPPRHPLMWRRP
jgi:nitroimidazol reductase NimA-like FMN-containing flavoprotein (pyridoxamine 5'-phosphate oxidase superfamily)/GNAT superfamily N-acetyltransferase